ncbi:MAG: DUF192 domain-containing protein [Rhodothermales bacterium]
MRLHLLALLCVVVGCGSPNPVDSPDPAPATPAADTIPFRKDGTLDFLRGADTLLTLDIEIADNDSSITRGMMQRESFPPMSAMLFVFANEEPRGFWMANTPLPLDIMFAAANGEIVHIAKYTKPLSPQTIESAGLPAQFVVEVPAGFSDQYGIIETDRIAWERE